MAEFMLRVTPSQLKTKANEIQDQINDFEGSWNRISEIIRNSKGYWVGDASNAHQKAFNDCQTDVLLIIKRLKEHPADLLNMAGIYEDSENKASDLAQALPDNVIV
jgi:WXG100 family type VII secretion target